MNIAALLQNFQKPSVKIRYKFLYDSVDRTDMLTKRGLGTVRRDVNLSAGKALVTLNNAGGWWNFLKDTNDALGDVAEIQAFSSNDPTNIYTIFKGTVRHPTFEGSTVTLRLKDHNSRFLDVEVGSNASPETFWASQSHHADQVVKRLLTELDMGNLSGLNSPANPDWDYTSWASWRDNHIRPNGYELKGQPAGQSVAECLMIICQMTHSYIWVNNDGKVDFAPPYKPGLSYDEGNTGILKKPGHGRDLDMPDDRLLNDVTVRRGYNFTTGVWLSSVNDTDATSIAKFGPYPKTIEGRVFTHNTAASATSDRDQTLVDYAFPLRFFNLTAGFPSITEDLAREITVDDTLKAISGATPLVESILYDLNTWDIKIKARWPW